MKRPPRQPPVFYQSAWQPDSREFAENGHLIELENEEASHAIKSLRLRTGDPVHIINGRGMLGFGQITMVTSRPGRVEAKITDIKIDAAPPRNLTLASALPKGERQGILLDMAIQLGISEFIPLECEFSAVRFKENMMSRWHRIAISACKQCRRLTIPTISAPMSLQQLIASRADRQLILFGDRDGESISQIAEGIMQPINAIAVVVGPEGGFSSAETDLLHGSDRSRSVSAGPNILRTEAAGIALVGLANQLIQSP